MRFDWCESSFNNLDLYSPSHPTRGDHHDQAALPTPQDAAHPQSHGGGGGSGPRSYMGYWGTWQSVMCLASSGEAGDMWEALWWGEIMRGGGIQVGGVDLRGFHQGSPHWSGSQDCILQVIHARRYTAATARPGKGALVDVPLPSGVWILFSRVHSSSGTVNESSNFLVLKKQHRPFSMKYQERQCVVD